MAKNKNDATTHDPVWIPAITDRKLVALLNIAQQSNGAWQLSFHFGKTDPMASA
jgi:hypothetical protein